MGVLLTIGAIATCFAVWLLWYLNQKPDYTEYVRLKTDARDRLKRYKGNQDDFRVMLLVCEMKDFCDTLVTCKRWQDMPREHCIRQIKRIKARLKDLGFYERT